MFSWLLARATSVYQWFGSNYATYYWRIRNLYSLSSGWIATAYGRARSYTISKFNEAKASLAYLESYLAWQITRLRSGYQVEVQRLKDNLLPRIQHLDSFIAWQITRIDGQIRDAASALGRAIRDRIDYLESFFAWQLTRLRAGEIDWPEPLASLIAFFTPEMLRRLAHMLDNLYLQINSFFENPIAWIFGLIWSEFTTFFCYIMAVGLGTTDRQLPPPPMWGKPGYGGDWTPFLPPGSGELGKPMAHCYISGYTFMRPPHHMGIDLGQVMGTETYAMHDGVIELARGVTGGYANCVTVRGKDWWTRYAHLQGFTVTKGQRVTKGQCIALCDSTGNSTGPHLHLEIKHRGKFVDPGPILGLHGVWHG
jgi:hypothetical protein